MSDDLEEIEGVARTGGNLRIQITKAVNAEAGKREGLLEIEGPEKIKDPGKRGEARLFLESTGRVILMYTNITYSKFLEVQRDDGKRNG